MMNPADDLPLSEIQTRPEGTQAQLHLPPTTPRVEPTGMQTNGVDQSTQVPIRKDQLEIPGFEFIKRLGRGGMGIVWLCKDVKAGRLVALKQTLSDELSETERARFRTEAQAMAKLRHPNIVQVFEVDEHDGRPYFTMEYCPGGGLNDFLAHKPQPPKICAQIVERIAIGVQNAHENGIIHRDLKPANVLIRADWKTPGEATASVSTSEVNSEQRQKQFHSALQSTNTELLKIIDFGLAKNAEITQLMTQTGEVMGTPSYMAPEQGRSTKSATASADIWSLGVILYESITGSLPFVGADRYETFLNVCHKDPVPPSEKVKCPRDLETICLKCLRKEPRDRYASAQALAEDLRAFLEERSISARPMGTLEKGLKWVRKNPVIAGLIVAVVVSTSLFGTIASLAYLNAKQHEAKTIEAIKRANDETNRANDEATRAKVSGELTTFLRELFISADPSGLIGAGLLPAGQTARQVTVDTLVVRGMQLIRDKFQGTSRSDRLTRAAMLSTIGDTSRSIGLLKEAEPLLREALQIRQELLPEDDLEVNRIRLQLANLLAEKGDFLDSEKLYEELLQVYRKNNLLTTLEAADVQVRFAVLLTSIGEERSEPLARESVATRSRILGPDHRDTMIAKIVLAASLFDQEKLTEALQISSETIEWVTRIDALKNDPIVAAVLEYQMAFSLENLGFRSDAIAKYKKSVELMKKHLGSKHVYNTMLIYNLAHALGLNKEYAEAEKQWRECLELSRETVGLGHPRAAALILSFSSFLVERNRTPEALKLIEEGLEAIDPQFAFKHRSRLAILARGVKFAVRSKEYELARRWGKQVLEYTQSQHRDLRDNEATDLANACLYLGDLPEIEMARQGYTFVFSLEERSKDPEAHWTDNHNFAGILIKHQFYAEAEPYMKKAVELLANPAVRKGKDFRAVTRMWINLAKLNIHAGRFDEVAANFREALIESRKALLATRDEDTWFMAIKFDLLQHRFREVLPLVEELDKFPRLSPTDRAWLTYLRITSQELIDESAANPSALDKLEKTLGTSTDADVAMYRARTQVVANGDVERELSRLNALLQKPNQGEPVHLARVACALHLNQPELALKSLESIQVTTDNNSKSNLRAVLAALAEYRKTPQDSTQTHLREAIQRAELYLKTTKTLKTLDVAGYAISNQLELRWWCRRIGSELEKKP